MEILVCDGVWIRAAGGYLDCDGTVSTMTLEELREGAFVQLTGEDKASLTLSFITFFCLIFVMIKLRRLA